MNDVVEQTGGFYFCSICYNDTDSLYIHRKNSSSLVDNGFVGKSLGLVKKDYDFSGIFYAWILALSAERNIKGHSEEHRKIKPNEYISLSEAERKTIFGWLSIDWTKSFEWNKIPHWKQDCLRCKNEFLCGECVVKRKMNCFNCGMERACGTCLAQISQNETYSTEISMLKAKPTNEYYQMRPYYVGEYEPKQKNIDLESAIESLLKGDDKMVVKRCSERIYNIMESKIYMKNENYWKQREIYSWTHTY